MPIVAPLIGAGISGLAGLFGGKKQQETSGTQTTSGTQNVTGSTSGSSTPNLSPMQQNLASLFSNKAIDFANSAPDLTGYTQGGIENINQANAGSQAAMHNLLAARGLSFSPAYATAAQIGDQNRQSQITQFLSQIPLLQRSLQQQGIQGLEQAFSTVPVGTSTTGSNNQTTTSNSKTDQTGTVSGNPVAGLFSGLGAGLLGPSGNGNDNSNLVDILKSIGIGGGKTPPFMQNINGGA